MHDGHPTGEAPDTARIPEPHLSSAAAALAAILRARHPNHVVDVRIRPRPPVEDTSAGEDER